MFVVTSKFPSTTESTSVDVEPIPVAESVITDKLWVAIRLLGLSGGDRLERRLVGVQITDSGGSKWRMVMAAADGGNCNSDAFAMYLDIAQI
ncbi:hypothetical protein MA16_Dca002011 [Dendrobium catenatum]|uniref:Uncharacterized protein n=1 Tax=Dendrobium catenatum TaxID=906689 RepID=A0A2I0XE61_9ASPA|nr:hypothetical protein MA16_Dca002011 [Dendrobium catenatum]